MKTPGLLLLLASAALASGTVAGRVIDAVSGEPVAGVQVTLAAVRGQGGEAPSYVVESGEDGRFVAPDVAEGSYTPLLKKYGYSARPSPLFPSADEFPPFRVTDGETATGLEWKMIRNGVISGRALDSDGDPIRNVDIHALTYQMEHGRRKLVTVDRVTTDDRGEYRLFDLPPNRYYIRATRPPQGCSLRGDATQQTKECRDRLMLGPAYFPGATDAAHAKELIVAPGGEIAGTDLQLSEQRRFAVHANFDQPARWTQSTELDLVDRQDDDSLDIGFRRRESGFEIFDVGPGSYALQVTSRSTPDQFSIAVVEVRDEDVSVTLQTMTPVVVDASIRIEGAVKEAGTTVQFEPANGGDTIEEYAEAKKHFSLTLLDRAYQVKLADSSQAFLKAILVGQKALPEPALNAAAIEGPVTIVLSDAFGSVTGMVSDESGQPVANASVTLLREGEDAWENRFRYTMSDSLGRFALERVIPGAYRAHAWLGAPMGEPEDPEFRKRYEDRGTAVTLGEKEAKEVTLRPIALAPDGK